MTESRTVRSLLDENPSMRLVSGDPNAEVSGVQHDSRSVGAGTLFVAIRGFRADGHAFIAAAADAGASAVLVEESRAGSLDLPPGITVVAAPETRPALAAASAWVHGHPSRELTVVGITGTDGKTTTSYMLTSVLEAAGLRVGRLGTVDAYVGGETDTATARMTTPEANEVQRLLRRMVDAGCDVAIVESTSHGLALHRLDHVAYDVAAFTNITGDHLDFHETFEAYREAKAQLFAALETSPNKGFDKTAVVNDDDPSANFMLGQSSALPLRYGMESRDADILARNLILRPDGSDFRLITPHGPAEVSLQVPAIFNVANALAAASCGFAVGLPPSVIAAGLGACAGIPGRMERVHAGQPFEVVVDYAHTGDAVRKVLSVLREVSGGRLIIVVGAAGERDPGRRFGVGRAAAEQADYAVFTSEDPRSEDPAAIVREIGDHAVGAGRKRGTDFVEIEDRREAIAHALGRARPGDTVVIAGKGHEQSIIYGERTIPWDDRKVAREELAKLGFGDG